MTGMNETEHMTDEMRDSSHTKEGTRRGIFVVFEGIDRCGKTTQTKLLMTSLEKAGIAGFFKRYPNRTNNTGTAINSYLSVSAAQSAMEAGEKSKRELLAEARTSHLLFCANRFEDVSEIENALEQGKVVVCDRYFASGIAYSAAKGLDMDWCRDVDKDLPQPDLVIFLDITPEEASRRGNYGEERFENVAFQTSVMTAFHILEEASWIRFDATQSVEQLSQKILQSVLSRMKPRHEYNHSYVFFADTDFLCGSATDGRNGV